MSAEQFTPDPMRPSAGRLDPFIHAIPPLLLKPEAVTSPMLTEFYLAADDASLVMPTEVGDIAVEVRQGGTEDAEEVIRRRLFNPPARAEDSGDISSALNAPLSEQYPFVALPDRSNYTVRLQAPLSAVQQVWSEPQTQDLSDWRGMTGVEVRQLFPELEVDDLTKYSVAALTRTLPGLAAVLRTDNREPATRHLVGDGHLSRYHEMCRVFEDAEDGSDCAVVQFSEQITVGRDRDKSESADFVFSLPDGHEQSNEHGLAGLVELVIYRTLRLDISQVAVSARRNLRNPHLDIGLITNDMLDGYRRPKDTTSSLGYTAGETRVAPARTISTSTELTASLQPIAIARFALVGQVA